MKPLSVDPQANPVSSQWVESLHNELKQLDEAGLPFTVDNLTASLFNMLVRVETEWAGATIVEEGEEG